MQNTSPEPTHLKAFKWRGFFLLLLLSICLTTLLAIVKTQHEIRSVESTYYQTLQQALEAREEWGRLMLEKQHLTSPARVEQQAKRLDMTLDKAHYQYIYVEPDTSLSMTELGDAEN